MKITCGTVEAFISNLQTSIANKTIYWMHDEVPLEDHFIAFEIWDTFTAVTDFGEGEALVEAKILQGTHRRTEDGDDEAVSKSQVDVSVVQDYCINCGLEFREGVLDF